MSGHLLYWVSIDFSTDHQVVRCVTLPRQTYTEFDGPFDTMAEAKDHIRWACAGEREGISDKLNWWMSVKVADCPIVGLE